MDYYDVVVIGCGPAGGECARQLSKKGVKLLLVEKGKDFAANNYSSGGVPLSVLTDYSFPATLVGSYWNRLTVHSSYRKEEWSQPHPFGAILDFQRLREFLAEEVVSAGNTLLLDTMYLDHREQNGSYIVNLRRHGETTDYAVRTKIVVDGTGTERAVLAKGHAKKDKTCIATGIEYLIQVPEGTYSNYANNMSLFLGHRWMPQGYGWVFPMQENKLKVGIIRYFAHDALVPFNQSYKFYLDHLIEAITGSKESCILDKHGKSIYYTYGRKDPHYKGPVIALGDAVSMINPLACEGIRHALYSGNIAHEHILEKLSHADYSFSAYQKNLKQHCGRKWFRSEWLMKKMYTLKKDKYYDVVLNAFRSFGAQDMMQFAFGYKFSKLLKFCFGYYFQKIKLLFREGL